MKRWARGLVLGAFSCCLFMLILWSRRINDRDDIGRVYIEQGYSEIYFEKQDTKIKGQDIGGATFFFLPSYIRLSSVYYDTTGLAIFQENGDILVQPNLNTVESVLVGKSPQDSVSYRVGFFNSNNLNTIEIELKDQSVDELSRDAYAYAEIRVRTPKGRIEYLSQQALIKGRGNTTWEYEKKPYDIKFGKKVSIAGMGASDEWTLLANALDPTCLRNRMAFDVAELLDMEYVTESEWIDLYIDNEYRGNFLACHEVSEAPEGWFLLEQHATAPKRERYTFRVPSGLPITVKSPNSKKITEEDKKEIESFTRLTDDAIMNHMPDAQYKNIDRYSFVRRFLVDEISLNADMDFSSHFYYKKPEAEVMFAGPCWDYDKAFGCSRRRDWNDTILRRESSYVIWDISLTSDEIYKDYLHKTFEEYHDSLYTVLLENIDQYYEKIRASVEMDRIRWNRGPSRLYENNSNDVRYLKLFLNKRINHLAEEYEDHPDIRQILLENRSTHKITLKNDIEEKTINVKDGTLLSEADLPAYDSNIYSGWFFDFDGRYEKVTEFIPIYEDMDIVLQHNSEN